MKHFSVDEKNMNINSKQFGFYFVVALAMLVVLVVLGKDTFNRKIESTVAKVNEAPPTDNTNLTSIQSIDTMKDGIDESASVKNIASYITPEYLETNWENEFGCAAFRVPKTYQCKHPELGANSYEEAIWMFENGYPSESELSFMEALSDNDLLTLAKQKHWLANLLLAQRAAEKSDSAGAGARYFRRSLMQRISPYTYRKWADTLVENANAKSSTWAYEKAAERLQIAKLLGDYQAGKELYKLYYEDWGGGDLDINVVSSINESAYLFLSRYFGTIQDNWPVSPRPVGRG